MKNRILMAACAAIVVAVSTLAALVVVATEYEQGWGPHGVSVTTAHQRQAGFAVNLLSVYNVSGSIVFAMTDCTTQELATAVTAGTAIGIRPGMAGDFNCFGRDSISSVCVVTTNGTATVDFLGF
jgi:hypothetical protein